MSGLTTEDTENTESTDGAVLKSIKLSDCGIYATEDGTWAIFSGSPVGPVDEDAYWWCGQYGWVSPYSSFWNSVSDCWEAHFSSPQAALKKLKELKEASK